MRNLIGHFRNQKTSADQLYVAVRTDSENVVLFEQIEFTELAVDRNCVEVIERRVEILLEIPHADYSEALASAALREIDPISKLCKATKRFFQPTAAALGEDGLEVAFEEGAGVLEVLFGVGFGGGDAFKRFVEDANDPLLLRD